LRQHAAKDWGFAYDLPQAQFSNETLANVFRAAGLPAEKAGDPALQFASVHRVQQEIVHSFGRYLQQFAVLSGQDGESRDGQRMIPEPVEKVDRLVASGHGVGYQESFFAQG
jgi:hypothetical protein